MRKVYLAGPLFSEAELNFNRNIRDILAEYFEVYLPQEDGGLMLEMLKQGTALRDAQRLVFAYDVEAIRKADYVLIILDGRSVDEGASFELGYGYALGKRCVGFQTDPRRLLPVGNNPMLECALEHILTSKADLISWAGQESAKYDEFRESIVLNEGV